MSGSTIVNTQASPVPCDQLEQALVIISTASLQTQGMALVLSRALQERGVQLNILLCDAAGDLAIADYQSL